MSRRNRTDAPATRRRTSNRLALVSFTYDTYPLPVPVETDADREIEVSNNDRATAVTVEDIMFDPTAIEPIRVRNQNIAFEDIVDMFNKGFPPQMVVLWDDRDNRLVVDIMTDSACSIVSTCLKSWFRIHWLSSNGPEPTHR